VVLSGIQGLDAAVSVVNDDHDKVVEIINSAFDVTHRGTPLSFEVNSNSHQQQPIKLKIKLKIKFMVLSVINNNKFHSPKIKTAFYKNHILY